MPETRRQYDPEFRAGAVRIVLETRRPVAEAAASWGSARARWATGCARTAPSAAGSASTATNAPSWRGCASGARSWRWSVMCSNDRWSCGSRRRRGERDRAHRGPEDRTRCASRLVVPRAGGGGVHVLCPARPAAAGGSAGDFANACRRLGVPQSLGRVGGALDNAPAESFFSTLQHELISKTRWATRDQARADIAELDGLAGIAELCGLLSRRTRHGQHGSHRQRQQGPDPTTHPAATLGTPVAIWA